MWSYLIAIPFLSVLVVLQSAVISRVPLLEGQADLVMLALVGWSIQEKAPGALFWIIFGSLAAGLTTALPFGVLFAGYLIIFGLSLFLKRRVWKISFLSMIASVFAGTIIINIISFVTVSIQGATLPIIEVFNLILLPSLILNLLFSVPMYIVVRDISRWLNPDELKV